MKELNYIEINFFKFLPIDCYIPPFMYDIMTGLTQSRVFNLVR